MFKTLKKEHEESSRIHILAKCQILSLDNHVPSQWQIAKTLYHHFTVLGLAAWDLSYIQWAEHITKHSCPADQEDTNLGKAFNARLVFQIFPFAVIQFFYTKARLISQKQT